MVFFKGGHGAAGPVTTGWDEFARRRRDFFWVPLCALWNSAVRILRSHFNGMGWAHLGCMRDGDGTRSWDAFHQWGPHGNPQKPRWDGMGWDETNVSHLGGTPLGLCHWQCGMVREIQHGTTRPQQPNPNEKQTIYGNYLKVVVVFCILQG